MSYHISYTIAYRPCVNTKTIIVIKVGCFVFGLCGVWSVGTNEWGSCVFDVRVRVVYVCVCVCVWRVCCVCVCVSVVCV